MLTQVWCCAPSLHQKFIIVAVADLLYLDQVAVEVDLMWEVVSIIDVLCAESVDSVSVKNECRPSLDSRLAALTSHLSAMQVEMSRSLTSDSLLATRR